MTKVMDIMEDFLKMMGWKHLRLDGGTKTEDRAQYVQLFNAPDSDIKVFILSTRAGGLGLNLQTADTVIIFDSDWNPHADLQAQDRAHRIGQTKAVLILRFITEKSVEEAMYSRALYKLDIDDKVIQAGRFDNKSTSEEQEALLKAILNADQDEDNEEAGDMNDDELNALIKRSDEEEAIFRQMDIDRERNTLETWRAAGNRGKPPAPLMQIEELPECYQSEEPFDIKETEEILEGRGQRRRNIVSYNDGMSDDAWAMALEEGEDFDDIQDRAREKKERRATNKLLKEASASGRGTPASDSDGRGRRGRKPKGKLPAVDFDSTPAGGKRKRGNKAYSETPSVNGDEEEDRDQKRRRTKVADLTPAVRDKMKKAFVECQKAVLACEDGTGRKRCELFRDLPDRRDYPDYYELIKQPIAISQIKKRTNSNHYKNVQSFRSDWKLMFSNARTYNQEGSWVYMDANEMEKTFDAAFERHITGSGLPGAPESNGSAAGSYDSALTPVDDDDRPPTKRPNRKAVVSDEEYLTSSDDD
jgi:ATP-dependent helicase STH1/SNF2